MITPSRCKRIIIIEGPDGGGKSTLAKELGGEGERHVVHLGPLKGVSERALARLYVEAMLPALHGHRDVVLDRSWLSEPIYGMAFRGGADRIGPIRRRQLERLAMRCGAFVVRCRPPLEACLETFQKRRGAEYLEHADQLRRVWQMYGELITSLPIVDHDYTAPRPAYGRLSKVYNQLSSAWPHMVGEPTAGALERDRRKVLLVGEAYTNVSDQDTLYQWPFGGFSGACSTWLTNEFNRVGDIDERDLVWVNADASVGALRELIEVNGHKVFALGEDASAQLREYNIVHTLFPHPQFWKRFRYGECYPLLDAIKEALSC